MATTCCSHADCVHKMACGSMHGPRIGPPAGDVPGVGDAGRPGTTRHRGVHGILTARRGPPTDVPEWRNWQTRGTQNPVPFTGSVGSIPSSGTSLPTDTPSFGLVDQRVLTTQRLPRPYNRDTGSSSPPRPATMRLAPNLAGTLATLRRSWTPGPPRVHRLPVVQTSCPSNSTASRTVARHHGPHVLQ
jgi:hypothetical protein